MTHTPPRRYVVVLVLALVAVLVGLAGPWAYASFVDTSAKDRIEADPPPALFPDRTVAPLQQDVTAQEPRAHALMRTWWREHGRDEHDAAFVGWLGRTLPGPPSSTHRTAEVAQVQRLAGIRTASGVRASTWLEAYGKKDLWKLYAHDQAEMVGSDRGDHRKEALKDMLTMAKDVADSLALRYEQPAPYVLHPSLRPEKAVTKGQTCPCSYPSRHAARGAAATTFLSGLDPHRSQQYHWTEAEIDYSRVYMAGHVPSDITGGALLGDLIGEYFLVTRHDSA
ncbi:MAG: phosphatase PAP2 family protein [Nocardioidaceae bacterium]|nr:phosphatase PAP2 family protein [Nocardioidaceae bacterium]NUS51933.1 phosphatase PAP2 family protein [Nocardioidaceae bacterium]